MEFLAQKSDLLKELDLVQGVVEKKTTIPILSMESTRPSVLQRAGTSAFLRAFRVSREETRFKGSMRVNVLLCLLQATPPWQATTVSQECEPLIGHLHQ